VQYSLANRHDHDNGARIVKLTISSSSMMNPIFLAEKNETGDATPDRILGLLTMPSDSVGQHQFFGKVVEYRRPDQEHPQLKTALWSDFQPVKNNELMPCIAVFGFHHDGHCSWYQLWNTTTNSTAWVMHSDNLVYEPFSILAMDALVSLLANWQGLLYHCPENTLVQNPFLPKAADKIDANFIHSVRVSDASTSIAGQLWFLVTVHINPCQSNALKRDSYEYLSGNSRSGWITDANA